MAAADEPHADSDAKLAQMADNMATIYNYICHLRDDANAACLVFPLHLNQLAG